MASSEGAHRDKRAKPGIVLYPMDETLQRKCDVVMKTIMKKSQAQHFASPVDWEKLKIPDYPKLIKQPMDLGTVGTRLSRSHYVRLEEWAHDMRLVWKNAFIFNAPDSLYFKAAKTLSDVYEKKLEELEKDTENAHPLSIDSMERCNLLLADMKANPLAEWFKEPVDHEGLKLTDYLKVIATPMDLGTVHKKIERSQYLSADDFAGDVRLIWQNAITYNSATSMFGVVSSILAQTFERRFGLITRAASLDPGKPRPDRAGWPTFLQKKKFYDMCTKLTLPDLNQMVGIVQQSCTSAVQQCGQKEVEVDVDELDMETFNKLMTWVNTKQKPVKAEG